MKNRKVPELVLFKRDIEVLTSSFDEYKEHSHEFYEFEYVAEGSGEYVINGKTYKLERNDLVFVTPLDLHSYNKGNEHFRTITVKFVPESLSFELRSISKIDSFLLHCDEKLKEAFIAIGEERSSETFKDIAFRNCLERIIILILRNKNIEEQSINSIDIEHITGYINQNFRNVITLEEVAKKCGYSHAHFCRQFKKITGKTFVEYLNGIRIQHAKNLLITTSMTVTDISYECGFGSVRNMNREFFKKYSCSPLEYRKERSLG